MALLYVHQGCNEYGGGEYEYEYEYGVPNTNIFTNINDGYIFLTLPTFKLRTDAYLPLYVGYTSVHTRSELVPPGTDRSNPLQRVIADKIGGYSFIADKILTKTISLRQNLIVIFIAQFAPVFIIFRCLLANRGKCFT